jgi:hypothetical protein
MSDAGWSSLVARRAHNPEVEGSNPSPAIGMAATGPPARVRFWGGFFVERASRDGTR